jgi:CCR4-NOT transcription complex subunit 10
MSEGKPEGDAPDPKDAKVTDEDDSKARLRLLAGQAKEHFQQEKFDDAIAVLKSIAAVIEENGSGDLKVYHNIALCEHRKRRLDASGDARAQYQKFMEEIMTIKRQAMLDSMADIAPAPDNNGKDGRVAGDGLADKLFGGAAADGVGLESSLADKGADDAGGGAGQAAMSDGASGEINDEELAGDPATSLLLYNQAIVLLEMKERPLALATLEALFSNVMLLEEPLALKTCSLLLDVYIGIFRGNQNVDYALGRMQEKAAAVIEYLEKHSDSISSPVDDGRGNTETGDDSMGGEGGNKSSLSIVFKFKLKLCRAQLELLLWNAQRAKKEVKSALEIYQKQLKDLSPGSLGGLPVPNNTTGLLLKANLEYLRQNYKKSVKLLNSCLETGQLQTAFYLNNMGCIHFSTGRYHTASLYFGKALAAVEDPNLSADILYNNGLQLLLSGVHLQLAFECFSRAAVQRGDRPHLWMRMAECCMMAHARASDPKVVARSQGGIRGVGNCGESERLNFKNDVVDKVVGSGPQRRMLLPTGRKKKIALASAEGGHPKMTMEYASMYLRNVLHLTQTECAKGAADASADPTEGVGDQAAARNAVRNAAFIGLSYCGLSLDHPMQALTAANEILAPESTCSTAHALLARTYAAEALCMLNRPGEALAHVEEAATKKEAEEGQEAAVPFVPSHSQLIPSILLKPRSKAARAALCVNVAAVRLQLGEFGEAESALHQALALNPSSSHALRTLVYLRLKQGDHGEAMSLLKQRRPSPSSSAQ